MRLTRLFLFPRLFLAFVFIAGSQALVQAASPGARITPQAQNASAGARLAPQAQNAACTLNFPFSETFTGPQSSIKPDWKLAGNTAGLPVLTGTGSPDPVGSGWLRLTDLGINEASSAYYDCAIPTARGLVIEFDYATWGGNGADGLSFFLFDGSTPSFNVGADGGSLGYAQKTGINGMSGGYLGLGIDEFGNFSNPTEGRVGGPGSRPDSIAIRGPGSGTTGYDYLSGTATLPSSIDVPSVTTRPNQNGSGRRHIVITLTPSGSTYLVAASITFGTGGSATTYSITPYTMTLPTPATLKMGFAASTGSSNNYHEIRNLTVNPTVPDITALKSVSVVGGGSAVPDGQLLYTVTLINQLTTSGVTGLVFTDPIPANTTYVAGSATVPAGATLAATSPTLRVTGINLAAAGQATIAFRVRINTPLPGGVTTISNQGTVTGTFNGTSINASTDGDSSTSAAEPTVIGLTAGPNFTNASKTVAIAGGGATVGAGGTLTYTVILPNSGNQHALNNSFIDVMPASTTYVAGSAAASSGTVAYNSSLARIEWNGTINAGSQVTLTFQVTVNPGVRIHQVISNQGALSYSASGGSTPDTSILTDADLVTPGRQTTDVQVAGAVTMQALKSSQDLNGGSFVPGDTLRYTVTLANTSNYTVDGVEYLDGIDPNTAYVANSLVIPGGSVVNTAPIDVTGMSVPANSQVQLTFDVRLNPPIPAGVSQVSNQGSLRYSSTGDSGYDTTLATDANPATPGVREPTLNPITASPAFAPLKSVAVVGGGDPMHGSMLEYTVTLQNTGNMTAAGAGFTDSLVPIQGYVEFVAGSLSATSGAATYNAALNQVEWSGDLAVGASTAITFRVRIKDLVGPGITISNTGALAYNRLAAGALVPAVPVGTNPASLITSAPILNYGDLPAAYALTTLAQDGARHTLPPFGQIMLGDGMRTGMDGVARNLDDPRPLSTDDGVAKVSGEVWSTGQAVHLSVKLSGSAAASGYLVAWFDWNGDRSFGAGERVIFPDPLPVGVSQVALTIPGPDQFTLSAGETLYARFRLYPTLQANPQPAGEASNGEIEDYQFPGGPTAVNLVNFAVSWQPSSGVLIKWKTSQDTNTLGFNIYRRQGIDGVFSLLNASLIPVNAPGSPTGGDYAYHDLQALPGVSYTYRLEAVDTGLRTCEFGRMTFITYPTYLPITVK